MSVPDHQIKSKTLNINVPSIAGSGSGVSHNALVHSVDRCSARCRDVHSSVKTSIAPEKTAANSALSTQRVSNADRATLVNLKTHSPMRANSPTAAHSGKPLVVLLRCKSQLLFSAYSFRTRARATPRPL